MGLQNKESEPQEEKQEGGKRSSQITNKAPPGFEHYTPTSEGSGYEDESSLLENEEVPPTKKPCAKEPHQGLICSNFPVYQHITTQAIY